MSPFDYLVAGLIYFLIIGIDVLSFFIIVRVIRPHWSPSLLVAFDSAGKPLLDWLITRLKKVLPRQGQTNISEQKLLGIGFLALLITRYLLMILFHQT